jgi:hypothetical protein
MPISVQCFVSLSEPTLEESFSATANAAVAKAGYKAATPVVGTAVTQVSTATLNALGFAFLQSLVTTTQATCTLTFGRLDGTTYQSFVSLRPGEPAVLRLVPGTYAAQAADEGYRLLVATFEE